VVIVQLFASPVLNRTVVVALSPFLSRQREKERNEAPSQLILFIYIAADE
jgi:hypothetical protein